MPAPPQFEYFQSDKTIFFSYLVIIAAVSISADTLTTVQYLSTRWRSGIIVRIGPIQMLRLYILFQLFQDNINSNVH